MKNRESTALNLLTVIVAIVVIVSGASSACGEGNAWDCPECGRTGNTGNYCGSCSHPAPWIESGDPAADELGVYKEAIDTIETIVAKNPWSLESIKQAFIEQYGSEKAVMSLEKLTNHRFKQGNVELSFYNCDWYCTYSARYYDESKTNYLFELDYYIVADQKFCDLNTPTYTNWFAKGSTLFPLTATSGNLYYLYCEGSTNEYVNAAYYDSVTVSEYIVWDGWGCFVE